VTDLSDFGAGLEESSEHDREAIADAFGVDVGDLEIVDYDVWEDSVRFRAPVSAIEADTRFIANRIADLGYDVAQGGENADHERFVTVRGGRSA